MKTKLRREPLSNCALRKAPKGTKAADPGELLNVAQTAKLLGVKAQTLDQWRSTGRHGLPFVHVGTAIRYRRRQVEEWLMARTTTSCAKRNCARKPVVVAAEWPNIPTPTADVLRTTGPVDTLAVDNAGAARLLGISESHLYGLKRAGKFGPAPVRLGRCCRYRTAEIVAWLDAGCPVRSRWQAMRGGAR